MKKNDADGGGDDDSGDDDGDGVGDDDGDVVVVGGDGDGEKVLMYQALTMYSTWSALNVISFQNNCYKFIYMNLFHYNDSLKLILYLLFLTRRQGQREASSFLRWQRVSHVLLAMYFKATYLASYS